MNKDNIENNNTTTLLSIIIPAYNTQRYLCKLITHLSYQLKRLSNPEEVEIMIIDGSDEDYTEYYTENYKSYPIIYYKKINDTAAASRNYGIDHTTGKYIVFVDSDDQVSDNFLSAILNKIKSSKGFDCCYYSWRIVGRCRETHIIKDIPSKWNWCLWTRVWSREYIGNVRFPENMNVAEDEKFIKEVCGGDNHDPNCNYENIEEVLYMYCICRDDNLCNLYANKKITKYTD